MKKNFCCGLAAFSALAFTACFDDSSANAVAQPVALDSSSSVLVGSSSSFVDCLSSSAIVESSSSAVVESSSSAVPGSSSSSFGLSSSDGVSSSSLAYSSSSLLFNSSSSSIAKSSASECRFLHWYGGEDEIVSFPLYATESVKYFIDECSGFPWPKNVVADGAWRIMETDGADGGKSSIVWPVDFSDGADTMATVNEYCQGICGTAVLDKGSMTYNPFVSVGFTLARDSSGNPVPVDVSSWGGICIVYTSDIAPALELDLGDSINANVLNYAVPAVSLSKATSSAVRKCFPWSSFRMPSWFKGDDQGWKDDTGAKAAKQLVGVKIRLQEKPKDGGYKFYVSTISAYDSGSGLYAAGPADQ